MTKEWERFDDVNHQWHFFFLLQGFFFFLPQLLFFFCISSLSSFFFYRLTSFFIQWIFIICNPHYPYCISSAMFRTAIIVSVVVAVIFFFNQKKSQKKRKSNQEVKKLYKRKKKRLQNSMSLPGQHTIKLHTTTCASQLKLQFTKTTLSI